MTILTIVLPAPYISESTLYFLNSQSYRIQLYSYNCKANVRYIKVLESWISTRGALKRKYIRRSNFWTVAHATPIIDGCSLLFPLTQAGNNIENNIMLSDHQNTSYMNSLRYTQEARFPHFIAKNHLAKRTL